MVLINRVMYNYNTLNSFPFWRSMLFPSYFCPSLLLIFTSIANIPHQSVSTFMSIITFIYCSELADIPRPWLPKVESSSLEIKLFVVVELIFDARLVEICSLCSICIGMVCFFGQFDQMLN